MNSEVEIGTDFGDIRALAEKWRGQAYYFRRNEQVCNVYSTCAAELEDVLDGHD